MENTTISITNNDKEYIKVNIPNLSEFVRTAVNNHKKIYDKKGSEKIALELQIMKLDKEFNEKTKLLKLELEKYEDNKKKYKDLQNNPEVIAALDFMTKKGGNATAVATNLSKVLKINISSADINKWLSE